MDGICAKTCVLFNSHIVDEEVIRRFRHVQAGCEKIGYDVKWAIDVTGKNDQVLPDGIDFVRYGEKDIEDRMKLGGVPSYLFRYNWPIMKFFELFPDYGYMWHIEYDVCFSGGWDAFFGMPFNDQGFDFIAEMFSPGKPDDRWMWWRRLDGDKNLPFWRQCLHNIARFSKKASQSINAFFVEFNKTANLHSELGYISACVRDGLAVCDLKDFGVLCPDYSICKKSPSGQALAGNQLWHAVKTDYKWPYC